MMYVTQYPSPLGALLLTSDGEALTGLWMEGQQVSRDSMVPNDSLSLFRQAKDWLDAYFRAEAPDPGTLPLSPAGTDFQKQVWALLLQIPWGETRSYGDIAREMARVTGKENMSPQAVGGAVGRNPIGIIIPCHRILGARGALTGYSAGLEKKLWLLRHEGHHHEGELL